MPVGAFSLTTHKGLPVGAFFLTVGLPVGAPRKMLLRANPTVKKRCSCDFEWPALRNDKDIRVTFKRLKLGKFMLYLLSTSFSRNVEVLQRKSPMQLPIMDRGSITF